MPKRPLGWCWAGRIYSDILSYFKINQLTLIFDCTGSLLRCGGRGTVLKNQPANAGDTDTRVRSLGQEDPLEKETGTHSSILVCRITKDRGAWRATVHRVAESDMTE